ncbi:MAG: hypothetical protein ACXVZX_09800, partial [Terriglobales bacterium]
MREVTMHSDRQNSIRSSKVIARLICVTALLLVSVSLQGKDKKKAANTPPPQKNVLELLDYSKIVWPNPPAITRIKFLSQFYGEKREQQ